MGINQPGEFLATLTLNGNPKVNVPVVMTVPAPETWGKVMGNVTDYCTGDPIVEALVSIPEGVPITELLTNDAGYYQGWFEEGSYATTFSADGYVAEETDLVITAGETVVLDVALRPDDGCLVYEPTSFDVTVEMGDMTVATLDLGNVGGADLAFEINEVDKGFSPALHIPRFTGTLPEDATPSSSGPAPKTNAVSVPSSVALPLAAVSAFAVDIYPGYNLVNIPDLSVPGTWNVVANEAGTQWFAGDFINGDFSTLYVIDYATNSLYAVDTATGAVTTIGPSVPGGGESWTGMTGAADGTMYASATTCSSSTLYTIDLEFWCSYPGRFDHEWFLYHRYRHQRGW